ncbi:hypothetical protein [Carboxylicivirga caseinilyticus]|uniref:hypothetical protein n=1 Tax=Carboxylicivirga caseinilyticus TaxID=3417572 RepID=UPI003D353176|nr:hypothetical protein [Marinilabiliaceae bacterium A049]
MKNKSTNMSENTFHTSSIPEIFYSDSTKKPFTHCKVCQKDVIQTGEPYIIEKAYGQDLIKGKRDMIFEVVYCLDCIQEINESLSEESRERISNYFKTHTNLDKRDKELKKYELFEIDIWLNNCIVKNKSIDEVDEFQIYALCIGNELLFHQAPYMVCGEAIEEVMELLSNKSLDILNDLMTDIIDLPPQYRELFKTRTPMIF